MIPFLVPYVQRTKALLCYFFVCARSLSGASPVSETGRPVVYIQQLQVAVRVCRAPYVNASQSDNADLQYVCRN